MVADCGRDGLLRAAASCRRRCPRRCCLRRAAAGAVGEDAERHDLEAPLVGAGDPTGPSRPRSLAPRCPARVGFLAGPLARNASAPAFALFLAGWAEHLALPAKERPCALGCVPFECVAFLGVLGEVAASGAAIVVCLAVGLAWAERRISAKSALGLLFNTAFATLGFLYLLHAVMPGHLDPFWGSIGAALAAPRRVAGALSSSGLGGLDAAGLGGAWRPMLWGSLWYLTVWRWAVRLCCIRAFMLESLPEWQDMNGLSVFWLYGLYGLLGSTVSLFVAVSALFTTWLKTCPLMRPVWLYLHSCIWALGACLSSERGHAPKSLRLDQCFGLVMLAWYLLAQLLWTPPLGSKFDEEAFLEAVMEKGGFQAKMENRSPSGPLARSLSANPVVRKLSSAILNVEAKDVESKREALKKGSIKSHGGKVALSFRLGPVVREDLLETSLKLLRKASVGQLLSSRFSVHFQGEWGVDWGGLTSDWFDSLAKALVKGSEHRERRKQESDDLFSSSLLARATDGTLLPRPSGYTRACSDAPERLQERWARLAAVGRFLGVAVLKGRPLPLSFGQVLMKLLCARDVSYSDVRHLDDDFYTHRIVGLLEEGGVERASAALTEPLTFVSAPTELMPEQVPLKEGGHQTLVTEENKMEYIELLSEARICNGRRHELQFFISGFHEVIPVDVLTRAKVSPAELSLLISGVHEYDVDEWRHHAQQEGDDQVLGWFWEAVASFSTEQRALLLSFSTGSSRIPPGGFENLEPQFRVCTTGEHQDRLPSAHTCFNQLDIPKYGSRELLVEMLLLAISADSGFGFV